MMVLRFAVAEPEGPGFADAGGEALAALAACPGYVRGQLGRAVDDATAWCLVTEWDSVGAYRRALGAYDVKIRATGLLGRALPEASAFEPLVTAAPGGLVSVRASDVLASDVRADDHGND
jgi:hypothetical protein